MVEKYYSLAIRKRNNNDRFYEDNNFIFSEISIDTQGRYWLADPFLFETKAKTYIFYEAFDLIHRKGCIGYSILNNKGTATAPKIIIKDTNHFSFPYIFEKANEIFIIPETCETNNLRLFRAKQFPDEWEELSPILNNVYLVDTILLEAVNSTYLLASEQYRLPPRDKLMSCWVKNRLFKCDENFQIKFVKNIAEGDFGVRNAGKLFKDHDKKWMRPGQDCTNNQYGKGLVFFKINSIEPYDEFKFYNIDCDEIARHIKFYNTNFKLIGCHTYNSSENYEIIDFSFMKQIEFSILLKRQFYRILNKISRESKNFLRACLHKMKIL